MSTEISNILMHTTQKLIHDVTDEVPDSVNNESVNKILNKSVDLIYSEWTNEIFQPTFCLLLDHNEKYIVLTIRGSISPNDFLVDGMAIDNMP